MKQAIAWIAWALVTWGIYRHNHAAAFDTYARALALSPANADQALQMCRAVNILDLTMQGNSNGGAPWMSDGHTSTRYY